MGFLDLFTRKKDEEDKRKKNKAPVPNVEFRKLLDFLPKPTPLKPPPLKPPILPSSHTVQPGDNLWNITKKVNGDPTLWTKLYQENKQIIGNNPDLILPKQSLDLTPILPKLSQGPRLDLLPKKPAFSPLPMQTRSGGVTSKFDFSGGSMPKFDFSGGNTEPHSWVADPEAWKGPSSIESKPVKENNNPIIGENLFLTNTFPIRQNDNLAIKGLKGTGNALISTLTAPGELLRKGSIQGGSLLTGNGLQQTPKNTFFTQDILPRGASNALNSFQQNNPILGGLTNAALETVADPTIYIGSKAVSNLMTPKAEQGMAKIQLPQKTAPNLEGQQALKDIQNAYRTPTLRDLKAQQLNRTFADTSKGMKSAQFKPLQQSIDDAVGVKTPLSEGLLKQRQMDAQSAFGGPREMNKFSFTTGEQRALQELQEGIAEAQNYVKHTDILAPYPPGTTVKAAYADVKANTGIDLPKLMANWEKAQVVKGPLSQSERLLGRRAGVIPPLKQREGFPLQSNLEPPFPERTLLGKPQPMQWTNKDNIPTAGPLPIRSINEGNLGQLPGLRPPLISPKPLETGKLGSASTSKVVSPLTESRIGGPLRGGLLAPKSTLPQVKPVGTKSLSFPATVAKGDITNPKLAEKINQTEMNYGNITNKDTLELARKFIQDDRESALHIVMSDAPATAESNAVAQLLIKQANDTGKFDQAISMIEKTSLKAKTQGQAIQALSMWGRLSPEGVLKYAVSKLGTSNLDEVTAKSIYEQSNKIQTMKDGREKEVAIAQMLDLIAAKVPPTMLQKIGTLQTMAQLLNPKTAIRNIVGNAGFAGIDNASNVLGAGLDKGLSLFTKQRTRTLPSLTTQLKGGKQGFKLGLEDALKGISTTSIKTQFDLNATKTFRTGPLGKLETAMNIELRAPDRAFYQAAYNDSLRVQMKAAKVTEPTEAMKEIADHDGLYKTFQDTNVLSSFFSGFKRLLNDPVHFMGKANHREPLAFGVGDFVIKYPKTPGNLLARGLDYSPVGFVKVIMEASKPLMGKGFDQRAFVDAFSRAIVGTGGLMGTGALLHRTGIISGKPDSDYDVAALNRQVGLGEYKVNVSALKRFVLNGLDPALANLQKGDTLITYDWFQPQALPLAMGADIDKNGAKAQGIVGTVLNGLATGTNSFAEQPIMQGINTMFGQRNFSDGITKIMQGIPASFVPTFMNQVKQLFDNQKRNTYSPNWLGKASNLATNKIPLLETRLQPTYDALGNKVQTYQNGSNNPLNVFLNPSFVSQYSPSKEAELALNAYKQTGETKQIPTIIPKYFTVTGERFDLTSEEYAEMQRIVGENTRMAFSSISPGSSTTDKQIDQMAKAISKARLEGKKAILNGRGVNYVQSGSTLKLK